MLMTSDVRVYENVLAIPSDKCFDPRQFLFDKDLNQISECGCFYNSFSGRSNKFLYTKEIPESKEIIDSGIFGGWICPYFSHFMMDTLSRLWYQEFVSGEKTYFFNVSPDSDWDGLYPGQKCINDFGNVFGFNPANFKTINQPTLFKKIGNTRSLITKKIKTNKYMAQFC
jgi:hypothetical protein